MIVDFRDPESLAALLLVGALTGGAYRQGRADGEAKIEAQQARESELAQKAVDAANATAAAAIAGIKVQHRTITQEVQREVVSVPQYRECAHSPQTLERINAAITGAAKPEPASSGVVPRAGAAD